MRLSDLETFVTTVREGSVTAAARRLFLTQPAVSARLAKLERDLGQPLLRRSGRGVTPTPAGEKLFQGAQAVLEAARGLEQEFTPGGPVRGRLALGATDLVAVHRLPRVLARVRKRHPLLEIAVQVEGTAALLRSLDENRIEFALGTLPIAAERFETEALYRDPIALVASREHPLAGRRRVTPAQLAAEPWIHHKRDSITRQQVEAHFGRRGATLRTEMEISSPEAIAALVEARLGIGALPLCVVQREVARRRLVILRAPGFELHRVSGLIRRRGADPTPPARAFLDLIREDQARAATGVSTRPGYAARPAPRTRSARRSRPSSKT